MSIVIRRAKPNADDVAGIIRLLHRAWEEWDLNTGDFDPEGVGREALTMMQNGGFVVVVEADGEIVGSLAAKEQKAWWSTAVWLCDMWTYVRRDYRVHGIGQRLIRTLLREGEKRDLPVMMGVFYGEGADPQRNIERKSKIYQRLGFQPFGRQFVRGV